MQRSTWAVTEALTNDDFLGGKVTVWQPRKGYRAGVDPVLLAAATPAKPRQSVLELGCGVGVASLCLAARVPDLQLTGVELQESYATLAQRNFAANAISCDVITADLQQLPADLRQQRFDHVIMNPPYFERTKGSAAANAGRDIAMGGDTPLATWLEVGIRRLAPRGYLTVIQRIERLPEVLAVATGRLGAIKILPIAGRATKPPNLFLLQARQEGRAPFVLLPAFVMPQGPAHIGAFDSYTPEASAILRDGAPLAALHT